MQVKLQRRGKLTRNNEVEENKLHNFFQNK